MQLPNTARDPLLSPPSDDRMHVSRRLLQAPGHPQSAPPPEPLAVDSDIVVILAALLCALICVVGLALVARCAWLRRSSSSAPPAPPNKGLKKKVLRSLPKLAFHPGATDARFADCPICLAEFVEGDEIRVLPQCGHGFHVACVDMWLASHSSCPSCRQILVLGASAAPTLCQKCGASSGAPPSAAAAAVAASAAETAEASSTPLEEREAGAKASEDGDAYRFLP